MLYLHDLLADVADVEITGTSDVAVRRIVADSRVVEPEDLFVAVRGTVVDGHDMVGQALDRGATVIVGERHLSELAFEHHHASSEITYVRVANSRLVHAHLLREGKPEVRKALAEMRFIGVTGTNGKTTVATVLEQGLNALGESAAFLGTTGYRFGGQEIMATHTTPDVDRLYDLIVQAHQAGAQTVVMEVSSHALDQERVDGIPFDVAVFTNLTRDHLDYHETMEKYAGVKQRLFSSLPDTAVAVLNGDDSWAPFMKRNSGASNIWCVGTQPQNRAVISDASSTMDGCQYQVDGLAITTPLVGAFNIINTALSAVVLRVLGCTDEQVQSALRHANGPAGRMEQYRLPKGALAVVDYAHTPDALQSALRTLRPLLQNPDGRLHVLFGCGGERDRGKRPEMGSIADAEADVLWITSDNPRTEPPGDIIEEIVAGVATQDEGRVHVIEDRGEAIQRAIRSLGTSDILLVAGKGHEDYQVIGTEKRHFSDAEQVRSASADA